MNGLKAAPIGVSAALIALTISSISHPNSAGTAHASTAPIAISGNVYAPPDAPISKITAAIWPNQQTLDALPVGADVPLLHVGVETSSNTYTVRLDPGSVPAKYQSEHGVDIEVSATPWSLESSSAAFSSTDEVNGESGSQYNETVVPNGTGWMRSPAADTSVVEKQGTTTGKPGDLFIAAETSGASATAFEPATIRGTADRGDLLLASALDPLCSSPKKTAVTHDHRAKIGDVMPSLSNMTGRIIYKVSSSHSLGVGIQFPDGSFKESGTITRSSSESVTPVFRTANHSAKTTWRYRDWKTGCAGQNTTARPESHQGGYYIPTRTHPAYEHCRWYPKGTLWESTTATAYTYQAGVTLWSVLNVNGQAGYDSEVKLQYNMPNYAKYLCGSNDDPPQARMVAGK